MAGPPKSLDNIEDDRQPDANSHSVFALWSAEWQKEARNRLPGGDLGPTDDTSKRHIPAFEITQSSEHPHNVTLHNEKKGTTDTVAGINPRAGESLGELVKRLHPNLSDTQLAKEVQKVLKYNHDYGNNLADGKTLDPSKSVFLTSVKYVDDHGRITRIEGPTGRVTEVSYDAKGMSGFKITGTDGQEIEEARKDTSGNWTASKDGKTLRLSDADIDLYGNITETDASGNRVGHLTRGDDVNTRVVNGKPVQSETFRNGEKLASFEYEATDGGYNIFARYADNPGQRVKITPDINEEEMKRITLALGRGPQSYAEMVKNTQPEPADVEPDQYVANRIARSALSEAKARDTVGWCYTGVADALDKVGVHLHGRHAYMAADQLLADRRFQVASINDLRPGDILVHGRTDRHESGHIAVYLGNGMEASDHVQTLIRGQGYGGTTVFRYVG